MVFNNADTLWFGVAGAVPSYGVLEQRYISFRFKHSNSLYSVAYFLAKMLTTYGLDLQNLVLLMGTPDTQHRTLTQII